MGLGRTSVVRGRVVVRNGLHGLFDQLVTLILEALAITVLASVDTSTEVVILRRRRGGPVRLSGEFKKHQERGVYIPITISRDDIVDPQLLADLLDAQMERAHVAQAGDEGGVLG